MCVSVGGCQVRGRAEIHPAYSQVAYYSLHFPSTTCTVSPCGGCAQVTVEKATLLTDLSSVFDEVGARVNASSSPLPMLSRGDQGSSCVQWVSVRPCVAA
jgi:hypothetical protein